MRLEDLDGELRALTVHDVSRDRAERTRAKCLARLHVARGVGMGYWNWLEPVTAVSVSTLYLAAALRAATVLMLLP